MRHRLDSISEWYLSLLSKRAKDSVSRDIGTGGAARSGARFGVTKWSRRLRRRSERNSAFEWALGRTRVARGVARLEREWGCTLRRYQPILEALGRIRSAHVASVAYSVHHLARRARGLRWPRRRSSFVLAHRGVAVQTFTSFSALIAGVLPGVRDEDL
jgi:hypothetical protein